MAIYVNTTRLHILNYVHQTKAMPSKPTLIKIAKEIRDDGWIIQNEDKTYTLTALGLKIQKEYNS